MELQDFIAKFAEQFDETDASVFSGSTEFRGLDEWSSLTALSVIAMLDEEYDVQIENAIFRQLLTVEDVFNYIKSHK